jgi:hypothetical protein
MATAAGRSGISTPATGRSGISAATAASIGARGRGPFNYNRLTDVQRGTTTIPAIGLPPWAGRGSAPTRG